MLAKGGIGLTPPPLILVNPGIKPKEELIEELRGRPFLKGKG